MLQSLQMSAYQVLETEKEWLRIPSDIQVSWMVFFQSVSPAHGHELGPQDQMIIMIQRADVFGMHHMLER